jgi:hypothetical protein
MPAPTSPAPPTAPPAAGKPTADAAECRDQKFDIGGAALAGYRFGDRHAGGCSRSGGREFFVVARLPGSNDGQAPYVEEVPKLPVTGRIMRGIDRLAVLAEELITFLLREVSQDHLRICGIFRRLRSHEP